MYFDWDYWKAYNLIDILTFFKKQAVYKQLALGRQISKQLSGLISLSPIKTAD